MSRVGKGKAPEPDRDTWEDMKGCGKEVAFIARRARKTGVSANPRAKIVSYLRWALNEGLDQFERDHGRIERPAKSEVTDWAKLQAGKVMDRGRDDRLSGRMSDFGYKVAGELKNAYKKGWSLGAGTTRLASPEGEQSFAEVLSDVPLKYRDVFMSMCRRKMRHERRAICHLIERRESRYSSKPLHIPMNAIQHPEYSEYVIFRQTDPKGEDAISEGCMAALRKRDLVYETSRTMSDGSVLTYSDLTDKAIVLYRDAALARHRDQKKYEASAEYRRRQELLATMGYGAPEHDFPDRIEAELDDYNAFVEKQRRLYAERCQAEEAGPET